MAEEEPRRERPDQVQVGTSGEGGCSTELTDAGIAPELAMPDDQGDGVDDRHTEQDGPNDHANHGRGKP